MTVFDYDRDPSACAVKLENSKKLYTDSAAWEKQAKLIRKGIGSATGLFPLSSNRPAVPVETRNLRRFDGYSVENVRMETAPGYYLAGNLYRPVDRQGPFAGVLCPHGHAYTPNHGGRFRPAGQLLAGTLARMGAVVLAWDMVGWGESLQVFHKSRYAIALQLWNSIRCVDYLLDIPGVDPERIAVTGHSGGGTQSFLLAAMDSRIRASAPVVMVSAHYFGGCNCESGMPIHENDICSTNNVEIAACAAPRPQLLVSIGTDWTANTPKVEFPFLQHIYGLYGAQNMVENVHLPDEEHNYGPSKRKAVYDFFHRVIGLDAPVDESGTKVEYNPMAFYNRIDDAELKFDPDGENTWNMVVKTNRDTASSADDGK